MMSRRENEFPLTKAHFHLLFHALAGWIRTVRGDRPAHGLSTSSARARGTIYREFWTPFPKEAATIEDLETRGFLFRGGSNVSVGLTRQTVHFLDNSESLVRLNPEFAECWAQLNVEFTPSEIEAALTVAEILSYKRDLPRIAPGPAAAHQYHRFVAECIGQLFWPRLVDARIEHELHAGGKRVDIVLTNHAEEGFFHWVSIQGVPCPFVFAECKNFSDDPGNPAIDQIAGRLSDKRGRLGLLFCREIPDRERMLARCRSVLVDQNSCIFALDDHDLSRLLAARANADHEGLDHELRVRFRDLVS